MEVEVENPQELNKLMDVESDDDSRQPSNLSSKYQDVFDNDELEIARRKVMIDKYDEAWKVIIADAQTKSIEQARPIYEEFLSIFKTSGDIWSAYADAEMNAGNYDKAVAIFRKCIPLPHVGLWRSFMRCTIDYEAKALPHNQGRKLIVDAYEYALKNVGVDIDASVIWMGYINFLKGEILKTPEEEASIKFELRKLYQRALCIPMHNLEEIFKEYDLFENQWDASSMKKVALENIKKVRPKAQLAMDTYKERKKHIEVISKNVLARPPRGLAKERHQVELWRNLIEFEKKTPNYEPEDIIERVIFTFNKAILDLYHYPEIWHLSAMYRLEIGRPDECKEVYQKAFQALPNSLLLHFQYFDFLESHGDHEEANEGYKNLISKNSDPLVWIQYILFSRRIYNIHGARKVFFKAIRSPNCTYHVYVAAALLEYYVNKDETVAKSIFDLGLKYYSDEISFLLQYIEFLFHRNEDNDMRELFNKIMNTMSSSYSLELWNLFIKYEHLNGNIDKTKELLNKRSEYFPNLDPSGIHGFVQRYRFLDLWPCSNGEYSTFVNPFTEKEEKTETTEETKETDASKNENMIKVVMPDRSLLSIYKPDFITEPKPPVQPQIVKSKPDTLATLIKTLPKPEEWDGPLLDIDRLITFIKRVQV